MTPASRRWSFGIGLVAAVLGLLGLAWERGWFAPPRAIPGDLTDGDAGVVAAVQKVRTAVAREPKSADAWGRLGQVLQVHNFPDPAIEAYAEAIRLDPRNPDWSYLRASILLVGTAPADAIPDLERAMELGGLDELPRTRLAELLVGQGRFEAAGGLLKKVLEVRPADPRAHLAMAQVAVARQAWADCLHHLDLAAVAPPARKQACALRSRAFGRLGDSAAANRERALLAKLPDDPRWPDPLCDEVNELQVGVAPRLTAALNLIKQGQHAQGIAMFQEAIRDYPDSALAYGGLGRGMALTGRLAESEEALLKSLELSPESADVLAVLVQLRIKRKDRKGAMESLRELRRLKPTDAGTYYDLGRLQAEAGDRTGAIESFRQALRYRPDFKEARKEFDRLAKPVTAE